jgi:1-acyl-sn-glycerol-3-phosphate acyltransferase
MPGSLALSLRNVYETLAISWPTVLDAARGQITVEGCNERLTSWSDNIVRNARMRVEVRGREHFDPRRTYVVMSNHQSHYDIPVLFHVLGSNLRMVTKAELFNVPLFGRALQHAGFISVDRSNRERAIASLRIAKETLAQGINVFIAPEGTRSRTGQLLPFKKGGFNLALDVGLPILPIALRGTRDALPATSVRSRPEADVRVTILPPVDTAPYAAMAGKSGRDRLMDDVRAAIESGL